MTAPLVYLNGQFVPGPLLIPSWDAGFVFGATATDLVRTFRGRPFRLREHVARLRESCRLCRIPLPLSDIDLAAAAERLILHNLTLGSDTELALVMLATPGSIGYYAGLPFGPGDSAPTIGMHTLPLPFARYRQLFSEGANLVVPPTRHVPAECVDPRAKMRSRMNWWIADQEAKAVDQDASALLLDVAGYVTETAAANFLIVRDDTVISPPQSSVLGGISLLVVEELCGELGSAFTERSLTLAECQTADEALLTGTAFCVAGVRRLDGVELPWPGPVFQRLLAAWSARVNVDIAAQVLAAP